MNSRLARLRATGRLAMLATLEGASVLGLHGLGSALDLRIPRRLDLAAWRLWLQLSSIEDVVASTLWMVALALSYWLAISTAVYLAARARGIPPAVRALSRMATPAPLRRLIDRTVAVSAAVSLMGAVASAAPAGRPSPTPSSPPLVRILDGHHGLIVPPGGNPFDGRAPPR